MNSPLLCVDLVLRNQDETFPGLQDVGSTIVDFLGPGRSLSLHEACTSGSTKLLNWIWRSGSSSSVNGNASNWSLSSLLQSDCHYYQWQFSEALEVAVARGDLETVKWLFEHFKHCQVAVEVVEAAAWNGQLEILQYLLEHDAGVKSESMKVRVVTHTVHWGGRSLVGAVENGHADVAWWLHQHSPCGYGEADITNAIKTALLGGDMKLAEFLLPRGKFVLDYAEFCSHPDVVEWKLDCGYLQRDVFGSAVAMKDLVRSGRLDLMKRIAAQHEPPPEDSDWTTDWRCAMVHACVHGNGAILQWLMQHPAGRWTCDGDDRLYAEFVFSAAYKGNVEVMEYLFERGTVDKVRDALLHAIREGHLDLVKWLIEHFPESERIPEYCVLDEAARYGHLKMLEYLQGLQPSVALGYFPAAISPSRRAVRNSRGDKYLNEIFVPASDDYLKVHQTLCRYRTEWHPTEAMDDAAANGHLEVVKWLHLNRSEGCTTSAMDCAAANGHLDVVQWIHTHRTEGCTTQAMDGAAENGHLDVIKWLHRNRFEGCTRKAIEGALSNGYLRVADWLHIHLPELIPANVELWRCPRDLFELLLFQHFHFSSTLSPSLAQYVKEILLDVSSKSNHKHIVDWMQEKYPVASGTTEEEQW